jgi:hypothetical protein
MSALVRYLFPKSNIDGDNEFRKSMNSSLDPHMTKSKKMYDKAKYIKIVNKSYKDILLTPDELSFLETIPRKNFNVILNINRNNRSHDKLKCTLS